MQLRAKTKFLRPERSYALPKLCIRALRAKTKFLKPERSSGHRNVVPAEQSFCQNIVLVTRAVAKTKFLH